MTLSRLAVALAVAGALAGCTSMQEAVGGSKLTPDEFAVMPKAPLIMPPDYNLRPPKPGSRQANIPDPSEQARSTLYSTNPAAAAASLGSSFSEGEKLLLAYARATNVDSSIRRRLAAEAGQDQGDKDFADKVLFWEGSGATAKPVDAEAEAERLRKAQAAGKAPQPAEPAKQDSQ